MVKHLGAETDGLELRIPLHFHINDARSILLLSDRQPITFLCTGQALLFSNAASTRPRLPRHNLDNHDHFSLRSKQGHKLPASIL